MAGLAEAGGQQAANGAGPEDRDRGHDASIRDRAALARRDAVPVVRVTIVRSMNLETRYSFGERARKPGRRQELVRMTSCWVARVIAT